MYSPDVDSVLAPVNINNALARPTSNPIQEEFVAIPSPVGYVESAFPTPPIPTIKYEPLDDEEGIEEVIRQPEYDWNRSPSPANSSSSSEGSNCYHHVSATDIFRRPAVAATSQELLVLHFDKNTCGIMSVKDGVHENPWRTYVWSLGGESPALYHAIASMTAFHMCIRRPELRFSGMEHMRLSLGYLARGFQDGNIQTDAALATTLVLAFAEAFDTHITTGIQHLRGAKALVNQALTTKRSSPPNSVAAKRFRFLYNVWVYLDVLARLTSDDDDGHAFGMPPSHGPLPSTSEVDPLLGCSVTLFPLIGRVAALVQRVRKTTRNSEALIAQAAEVKAHIEAWTPEASYESPDDPSSSVDDCVNTAEAYRWATLLYLHQAVPELPSLPAQQLAAIVIRLLARVPRSSRSCIIHIYPLLVAGCEAVTLEDREWVKARWEAMSERLWIGNVKKAWEVVAEVWARRDRFAALNPGKGFGELATIRGRLHWFGVMREWNWEGEFFSLHP